MKKLLLITLSIVIIVTGIVVVAWHYAPSLAFRAIGKAIGGSIIAAKSSVVYKDGALVITLNGVRVKGMMVEGRIESCEAELLLAKGLYVRRIVVSDFDLSVQKERGALLFYPVPVERAEIRKGVLNYDGRTYVVREIKVSNFNTGKTLEFSIDGGIKGLGDIKTHGEGLFGGEKRSDIRGQYTLSQVDMAQVLKNYEGLADSTGTFMYRDGTLTVDGDVGAPYFSIWENFLTKRLGDANRGHIFLKRAGEMTDVTLTGLHFRDAPIFLRFTSKQRTLLYLELTTGFIPIPELMEYVDLARLSEKDWEPFSYVKDGEARVDRLIYKERSPLTAQIDIRGASAGTGNILFHHVEGSLRVDGEVVVLTGFSGRFGESQLSAISGIVPLKRDRDVEVEGRYTADVRDLKGFFPTGEIEAVSGFADGGFEVRGRENTGFRVGGRGALRDGRFVWRRIPLDAAGHYHFGNDFLALDGLSVKGAETDILLSGRIEKDLVSLAGKGVVDARQLALASVVSRRYAPKGPVEVEGELEAAKTVFSAKSRLDMTHLSFEIPGVMRKVSGVESVAHVSLSGEKDRGIYLQDLDLTLGVIKARASGRLGQGRIGEARLLLDVPDIDRASRLFFFDKIKANGELKADLQIEDLRYPIESLPVVQGTLSFQRGGLQLPFMAEPLTGINLTCNFEGERLTADLSGLQAGMSKVRKAHLELRGLEGPSFDLAVDMERFDPADFRSRTQEAFRLPVVDAGGLLARASGTFLLKADHLQVREIAGKSVVLDGSFSHRTVSVRRGAMTMGTGSVGLEGSLLLSEKPAGRVTGELRDVTARDVLTLVDGKSEIIDGKGSVNVDLTFAGRDREELSRSATGSVRVSSRDGVIKKWNLISKLLALSNIYDLLRGHVDLTRNGLAYRRLSASFDGTSGVFRTDNFLIDSPSMMITGQGTLDASKKKIDGRMLVSPLVTIDKVIDWIPLVRNVFRERKTGLLFFIYDVKGPVDDPEIRSSYAQSMGKQVFNIVRNAIRLPKEVLDLLPKEGPSDK